MVLTREAVMGIWSRLAARLASARDLESLESSGSSEEPGWLRRWVMPQSGRDDLKTGRIKQAAAEDVAELEEEDREYFRRDAPGHIEDDL
jgi:hypothetical protein